MTGTSQFTQLREKSITLSDSPYTVTSAYNCINVTTTGGNVRVNLPDVDYPIKVNKVTDDSYIVTLFVSGTQIGEIAGYQSSVSIESGQITKDEPWYPYDAIVGIAGVSGDGGEVIAKNKYGRVIAGGRGVAGTDDITVLHAARDFVSGLGGGVVQLGVGTFATTVSTPSLLPVSNVFFRGTGRNVTKIKNGDNVDGNVVLFNRISNSGISSVEIDGNDAGNDPSSYMDGILLFESDHCHAINCYVHSTRKNAIEINSWNFYVTGISSNNNVIRDNIINDTRGDGITIYFGDKNEVCYNHITNTDNQNIHLYSRAVSNVVHHNFCGSATTESIQIGANTETNLTPCWDNILSDNIIESDVSPAPRGILLTGGSYRNTCSRNKIRIMKVGTTSYGIHVSNYSEGIYSNYVSSRNKFIDNDIVIDVSSGDPSLVKPIFISAGVYNEFIGNNVYANGHAAHGINIKDYGTALTRANLIEGGIIEGPTSYAIEVDSSNNNIIDGVVIRSPGHTGVRLRLSSYCTIRNCDIYNCVYGIWLAATSGSYLHNTIIGNKIHSDVANFTSTLTSDAAPGDDHVHVVDPSIFWPGEIIHLSDDDSPSGEDLTISAVTEDYTGKILTVTTNIIGTYTTAQTAIVTPKLVTTHGILINNYHDYTDVRDNIIKDAPISILNSSTTFTHNEICGNVGHVAPGEVRTYSGSIATLTQDAFNSLDNPFGQAVRLLSLDIYVSTGATATTPNIDCGIGSSATTDYTTLFDDLPGETIGFYRSTITIPGAQSVPQLWESGSGNRYLNMSIKDAAATGMVATYVVTVMGL
ncbi:MAG: right-handed parallel beta-helix repeat-containing protein [Bacilli bacterium]|jgi:parallel beta-helix repeat protein